MKWHAYLCSALFALLSLFVGSVIINQNDTYAVSDFEVTLNSSNTTTGWIRPCGSAISNNFSNTESCSSYHYGRILINDSTSCPNITWQMGQVANSTVLGFFDVMMSNQLSGIGNFAIYVSSNINSSCSITYGVYLDNPYLSSFPSGSLSITENGTYDVTNYVTAVVDVPPVVEEGDYHDDLVAINNTIMIVPAVGLVIYFFYAIYKMLLGGKTL